MNIYGIVMAGGIGARMQAGEAGEPLPKQFLLLGGKPILIRTLTGMLSYEGFSGLVVTCPAEWQERTEELLHRFLPDGSSHCPLAVTAGGQERNETLNKALAYLDQAYGLQDEDLVVTQDAVRPFLTRQMIAASVEAASVSGAAQAVIPATDTIVESRDGATVSGIPQRRFLYQVQTPQTFRARRFQALYRTLGEEEKAALTDACSLFVLRGEKVSLVPGARENLKITYPEDLAVAEALLARQEGACRA